MRLEKAIELAERAGKDLKNRGAKCVVISGSIARNKAEPSDVDLLTIIDEDPTEIEGRYENVHIFAYSERYVNSLINAYNSNKDRLFFSLGASAMREEGRPLGWPLTILLNEQQLEELQVYYSWFQKQNKVIHGDEYINKLKEKIKS